MQALIEGIGWGLFLTILIGPIFFALIQAGLEYGLRAGLTVGIGIWFSDIIYISAMLLGFNYIQKVSSSSGFEQWMGLGGGLILLAFGLGTFFSKPPQISYKDQLEIRPKNPYISLFSKGFLVNAINPFTVFFWLGMLSNLSVKVSWGNVDYFLFFGGIIGTIMITDSMKVFLAKQIRKKLKEKHLRVARKISGIILAAFGIALIARTWWL